MTELQFSFFLILKASLIIGTCAVVSFAIGYYVPEIIVRAFDRAISKKRR